MEADEVKVRISPKREDVIGKKFYHMTILKDLPSHIQPSGQKKRMVLCQCDCGSVKEQRLQPIVKGTVQSCGCGNFPKQEVPDKIIGNRFYRIHRDMKTRCLNPNSKGYEKYGALGISISSEWKDFWNFYSDMFDSYFDGASLDRIDNSKGYSKENCRWVEFALQSRNKGKLDRNTSGITGVRLDNKFGDSWYVVCHWYTLNGKKIQKSFSIDKYGEELAFFLANEKRDLEIMKLNLQGAGYTESHGK